MKASELRVGMVVQIEGPGWRRPRLKAQVVEVGLKAREALTYDGELHRLRLEDAKREGREVPPYLAARQLARLRQPGCRVELLEPVLIEYGREKAHPEAEVGFRFAVPNVKVLREWGPDLDEAEREAAARERAREALEERMTGVGLVDGFVVRPDDVLVQRHVMEAWLAQVEGWQGALSAVVAMEERGGDVSVAIGVAKRALGVE